MKRRHCPTGKLKHFNKEWADITATNQGEHLGTLFKSYKCVCGWWHTYDRLKKRRKDNLAEPRTARRRRSKTGEPPPGQLLRKEQDRQRKRAKEYRRRERMKLPVRVWEDDGGALFPPYRPTDEGDDA
jgi:hypothetical protein